MLVLLWLPNCISRVFTWKMKPFSQLMTKQNRFKYKTKFYLSVLILACFQWNLFHSPSFSRSPAQNSFGFLNKLILFTKAVNRGGAAPINLCIGYHLNFQSIHTLNCQTVEEPKLFLYSYNIATTTLIAIYFVLGINNQNLFKHHSFTIIHKFWTNVELNWTMFQQSHSEYIAYALCICTIHDFDSYRFLKPYWNQLTFFSETWTQPYIDQSNHSSLVRFAICHSLLIHTYVILTRLLFLSVLCYWNWK